MIKLPKEIKLLSTFFHFKVQPVHVCIKDSQAQCCFFL